MRMDTKELRMERTQLMSELEIAQLETNEAAAARDIAVAAQAQARADIAQSKLAVLDYRIARADILATADGAILMGDVLPRVGEVVPLGESLLQFAPEGSWIIKLHVPEFAAVHLQPGLSGEFTTNARPDEANACEVGTIEPASSVVDGKNVFTAEATVDGETPAWLRSGMQGVARVNAGKRPVWWVWLHRAIDAVRLQLWKL